MSRNGAVAGSVIIVAVVAALGYAAWRLRISDQAACDACARPRHVRSMVVALVDGKREVFCCPACALSMHRQTGHRVNILQLTDYESDEPLKPEGAYLVQGSYVNHCVREQVLTDRDRQPSALHFDRCSPSMIAFARQEAADAFIRRHGGTRALFRDLSAAYQE